MRTISQRQKRRIRDAERKRALLEQKHRAEINAVAFKAREEGRAEGRTYGARLMREHVLDHAGRLYKEGKDDAAGAVREVHKQLPQTV